MPESTEQIIHDTCVEVLHALDYSIDQGSIGPFCMALDKIKPIVTAKLCSREHTNKALTAVVLAHATGRYEPAHQASIHCAELQAKFLEDFGKPYP